MGWKAGGRNDRFTRESSSSVIAIDYRDNNRAQFIHFTNALCILIPLQWIYTVLSKKRNVFR